MRILISNDDGYQSAGIETLADAVIDLATEVLVVAPEKDRSGASNSLTLNRPLMVKTADNGYQYINGTPTDCVHVALTSFLSNNLPDLILSGINNGENMGDDTIYSGTVAAAVEGHLFNIPALAFSLASKKQAHLPTAKAVVREVVEWFWRHRKKLVSGLRHPVFNINIPDCAIEDLQGWQITRLGKRHMAEGVIEDKDEEGNKVYWIGPAGAAQDAGVGTDFYAVANNFVSITPLCVDLTHNNQIPFLQSLNH